MYLLQKTYSLILNPIGKVTSRVDEKISNAVITLCCTGLIAYFAALFSVGIKTFMRGARTQNSMFCSAILFVLIVFSIREELKPVKWNKFLFYTFFIAGAGVVAISFLHPIGSGYRAWGMLMMFGFPCVYYVWNNRADYDELYKRLAAATVIVGIAFYIYCFTLAPKGAIAFDAVLPSRMKGSFYDANMLSMIGMIMVDSCLYMLLVNRSSRAWFALTAAGFGIGVDITLLGQSRLAVLAVLGGMFAFTVYFLKIRRDKSFEWSRGRSYLRVLALLVSVIVFIMAGVLMKGINSRALDGQNTVNTASTRAAALAVYAASNGAAAAEEDADKTVIDRFKPGGSGDDTYTVGRVDIWKNYARYLNLTGNDFSKTDWEEMTGKYKVKHAHNNFLEIGYRCGVPVAVIHTLLELAAGIICLIYLFGRRYREPAYMFCIVFMVTYAVQSLFDIATIPFERPAPFFFYMAMIPIFMYRRETEETLRISEQDEKAE